MADTDNASTPPLSVVVLDDDADFLQYLRGVLEGEGHSVRTVSTPDAFYQTVDDSLPDVVLVDIKMGRFSGEDVLTEFGGGGRSGASSLGPTPVAGGDAADVQQDVRLPAKPFAITPAGLAQAAGRSGRAAGGPGAAGWPQIRLGGRAGIGLCGLVGGVDGQREPAQLDQRAHRRGDHCPDPQAWAETVEVAGAGF
jgi:CheY-like chemotaxis protein